MPASPGHVPPMPGGASDPFVVRGEPQARTSAAGPRVCPSIAASGFLRCPIVSAFTPRRRRERHAPKPDRLASSGSPEADARWGSDLEALVGTVAALVGKRGAGAYEIQIPMTDEIEDVLRSSRPEPSPDFVRRLEDDL